MRRPSHPAPQPDRRRSTGYAPADPAAGAEFPIRVNRDVYPGQQSRNANAKSEIAELRAPLARPTATPDGAPNILLVVLGDVGYGVLSTFGGLVESATLERLAKGGLRYSRFHTAGLGAASRAALLTGRNHHTVGMGVDPEHATDQPGRNGIIPHTCATVAELLRLNGYATGWWGRCHNVPEHHASAAGPFDVWPTGLGFDHFYGYIGGECDQFHPPLVRNTTAVDAPQLPEHGYHLTTDLASDCVAWMRQQKAIAPDRPVLAYFAPPGGRAPHQPPPEHRGRHAGKFDFGWDEYRNRVYERQRELGVIPRDTRLTERPEEIPAWSGASADERRVFARLFENYADCLTHADAEVGRIVDALDEMSELENTLVLYLVGDNGCSPDGALTGALNSAQALDGWQHPTVETFLPYIDDVGKLGTWPNVPVGWAWAGSAPFSWTGQIASHFGGTRTPLVIHWPRRILAGGGVRAQFHHVTDLAPTILEVVGIAQPSMVNGVAQQPIEGVSMGYTFPVERAAAQSTRRIQYFEVLGSRAVYRDGWMASCRHGRAPWTDTPLGSFDEDRWELYRVAEDFSQSVDLAESEPKLLRELQDLFIAEAARRNVLPLDDGVTESIDATPPSTWFRGRARVTLVPGLVRLPESAGPKTSNVTHSIVATLGIPRAGAEGVIVCCGGEMGGWSLYVLNRRLVYHYNFFNVERTEAVSDRELPYGNIEVKVEFTSLMPIPGGPATVELFVDGEAVGAADIPRQVRTRFGGDGIDVGIDKCSPVSRAYRERRGFPFTGTLGRVTLEFDGARAEFAQRVRATSAGPRAAASELEQTPPV